MASSASIDVTRASLDGMKQGCMVEMHGLVVLFVLGCTRHAMSPARMPFLYDDSLCGLQRNRKKRKEGRQMTDRTLWFSAIPCDLICD